MYLTATQSLPLRFREVVVCLFFTLCLYLQL